ncbi:ketopantoate hydroxymethyltransferase [Sphaerotilus hippei]|uniref:3-methyl-2-oxobutanoate hydroxymethyltransferase n=1 Tax=Sphaerotilus hippei TaxID=744406 RepID=A0A318H0A0_9BURK|nr:3-methyl-2-oxobutanoate hydroxymethyltransferase [Sphaerotilus hippei]PXW96229.1 ketopantoate hydroxymethyltransferase [Sphaerotilus hippei]
MSSHAQTPARTDARKPLTLHGLRALQARGEKISMLTAYDATFARLCDDAGVDCLLVGDSLGMVIQGQTSTLPVTLEETVYHTRCVVRGLVGGAAWLIADLPFASYQQGPAQAMASAAALMQAGAQMVKLEGGGWTAETVRFLTERGVPVCAHLGLTPQSVHALGGYRIQGRDDASAGTLRRHATELTQAGASMMVLELMPSAVAEAVQADNPTLMTIGIGAGPATAGQVLVLHDMLGLTRGRLPRFVRNFLSGHDSAEAAVRAYVAAVKSGEFPDPVAHSYAAA